MATTSCLDADLLDRFPASDDVPLDTPWHREQIDLLVNLARWHHRARDDFYVGGNMFVYWDPSDSRKSSGPDFMFINGVERYRYRHIWAVWLENGRFPDVIVELMSPRTKNKDRKTNKEKYEQVFRTPEYFFYDPETEEFQGWRLADDQYKAITPNEQGWFWSEQTGLWLGTWYGALVEGEKAVWVRFYDRDGNLVPPPDEEAFQRAAAEHQRAETERKPADAERERAEKAEAELARLRSQQQNSAGEE